MTNVNIEALETVSARLLERARRSGNWDRLDVQPALHRVQDSLAELQRVLDRIDVRESLRHNEQARDALTRDIKEQRERLAKLESPPPLTR